MMNKTNICKNKLGFVFFFVSKFTEKGIEYKGNNECNSNYHTIICKF